jgi:A/G-specific adenine glycosylase
MRSRADSRRLKVTAKEIYPNLQQIRRGLAVWYDQNRRSLPWRRTRDPYAIWISEIMLQQTRVETVTPYFLRFLDHFPTVETLALAELGEVVKVWENLGYYARARNLHKAAREIVERFGGQIPRRLEEIILLPGIGRYTAGAILSIAFGLAIPAVDGNVRRVISRLHAIEESVDDQDVRERIEELVRTLVPTRDPGRFNQALMELGAVCCTPKSPSCPACPLQDNCRARLQGLVHRLPVRGKKKTVPHREVVAAVIRDGKGRILIVQRPARGLLGSLWKFPGGILNPKEGSEEGLKRIVRDELGLGIGVGSPLAAVKHAYTHFRITLTAFSCNLREGSPAGPPWRWADADEIEGLPFSRADRRIARSVIPAG